jgi:hypothetical protein
MSRTQPARETKVDKAAIVVLADTETHGELGRLVNALSTADEFKEHGDEVTIIFDGAGVRWAAELSKPEHRLHEKFEGLRDKVAGACHYCAGAFEVRDELEQIGFPLLRDHKGHPSLRSLVHDGYEIITF